MAGGMAKHERPYRGDSDVWLTPPYFFRVLGKFDLDPCAAPEPRPWDTAASHITLPLNGLTFPWRGRVWCNPPYGPETGPWLERMAEHGNGIALIYARTDTEAFRRGVWERADSVLFLFNRVTFFLPNGELAKTTGGGPSCLVGYGADNTEILCRASRRAGTRGKLIRLT